MMSARRNPGTFLRLHKHFFVLGLEI
jgi:hypothetical protein